MRLRHSNPTQSLRALVAQFTGQTRNLSRPRRLQLFTVARWVSCTQFLPDSRTCAIHSCVSLRHSGAHAFLTNLFGPGYRHMSEDYPCLSPRTGGSLVHCLCGAEAEAEYLEVE